MTNEGRKFFKCAAAVSGLAVLAFIFSLSLRESETEEIARLNLDRTTSAQESTERQPILTRAPTSDFIDLPSNTLALKPGDRQCQIKTAFDAFLPLPYFL